MTEERMICVRRLMAVVLLTAFLILPGCGAKEPAEPGEQGKADFSFILPEGMSLEDVTDTEASVVIDGQAVGGIVLTDIQGKRMDKLDDDSLFRYIDSCAPTPLIGEWISMFFEEDGYSMIRVDLKITDPQTNEVSNHTHYLFMQEEGVYDLWFDDALVDEDLRMLCFGLVIASWE